MAQRWAAPFDPQERKDFSRDWGNEMAPSGDTLASAAWTLPADAQAAGLTIAAQNIAGAVAVVWFDASNPAALDAALSGQDIEISHSITTTGGRTLHETIFLKIRDK